MHLVRDGKTYTVAEGHDWFWKQFADQSWEPTTFKIFDTFLETDKTFVDIGAWIGPTVLYAAPRAKQVFAFEPDQVAYRSLVQNLELNRIENVVPYPIAVADRWKGMNFGSKGVFGDSMSGEMWAQKGGRQVPAISLEAVVLDLAPNFIKIDIEGGERTIFDNCALALTEMKPTIHLSLHTPFFKGKVSEYQLSIMEALDHVYPYFFNEIGERIKLIDAFDPNAFNSVVATFKQL